MQSAKAHGYANDVERVNAGMTMSAVAMIVGCSTRAIRQLRQRFQATGRTEDRPRSGRRRVATRGQASQEFYLGSVGHLNSLR